jgi:hypothetical protein
MEVRIILNRGYAGWSFLYENCRRLKTIEKKGIKPEVLYLGDFDPLGGYR